MNATIALTLPISQLTLIQIYLTRFFMIPLYICGILGNIANFILFSQKRIRLNNACVRYFAALSIVNVLVISVGGFTRSLPFLNGINPETTSILFCKCRHYIIHFSLFYMRSLVSLISIDRWMVTSTKPSIRQLSTPKIARYIIIVVTMVAAIFSIHAPIGFGVRFNLCYAYLNMGYIVFFTIYNILTAILPVIIMIIFSMLIMKNVRQSHKRIEAGSMELGNHSQPSSKTIQGSGGQFLQLVLIQSLSFILLNMTYALYVIYDTATNAMVKSSDQRSLEAFLYALSVHPVYIFCSVRQELTRIDSNLIFINMYLFF